MDRRQRKTRESIFSAFTELLSKKDFDKITVGEMKLPLGFVWVVLLIIVMSIFLNKTKPGRYIIAIGSNKEATRLSGVNVVKWHMLAYIICGVFTGLAGIAYWINDYFELSDAEKIEKSHPVVQKIKDLIDKEYADGRRN